MLAQKQSASRILRSAIQSKLVRHYYFGGGRAFDLERAGLLQEFRSTRSVSDAVAGFRRDLETRLRGHAYAKFRTGQTSGSSDRVRLQQSLSYNVTFEGPQMFPIGDGNLTAMAQCNVSYYWKEPQFGFECGLFFQVRDRFVDARDIRDQIPGNQELFGKPFAITARWNESMVRPFERFR